MATSDMDPNRGAAPPNEPYRGARRPGLRALRLVPLLWAPKWRPWKSSVMGGAPVLGGRHLKIKRDNQPKDGVGGVGGTGEAMRTGGTRGGGRLPVVSGGELRDEKKRK